MKQITEDLTSSKPEDVLDRVARLWRKYKKMSVAYLLEIGRDLRLIRDEELWRGRYESFKEYVEAHLDMSYDYARRLIRIAHYADRFPNISEQIVREDGDMEKIYILGRAVEEGHMSVQEAQQSTQLPRSVIKHGLPSKCEHEQLEEGWFRCVQCGKFLRRAR